MLKLFEMVLHVDDGYDRFVEVKTCFARDSETAVALAKQKFDPGDIVRLESVYEVEIHEGLFV